MVEDGDAGDNGFGGSIAKGIRDANYESGVLGDTRALYDRSKVNECILETIRRADADVSSEDAACRC